MGNMMMMMMKMSAVWPILLMGNMMMMMMMMMKMSAVWPILLCCDWGVVTAPPLLGCPETVPHVAGVDAMA
jgi:hypothetical protein